MDIGDALVIPESSFLISQGTTGLHIWEASSFLAEYFLENTNSLFKDGETILELGAGLGLASLALAKVHNHLKIIVSDFEVSILEILKEICLLNNNRPDNQNLNFKSLNIRTAFSAIHQHHHQLPDPAFREFEPLNRPSRNQKNHRP